MVDDPDFDVSAHVLHAAIPVALEELQQAAEAKSLQSA
jgi:hypothetical protein